MNILLLSGGSGKRLWPLSNDIRSKQFIKIFKNELGVYESMVQRVYHQIKNSDPNGTVTVATSKTQISLLRNQLGENVSICIEPCRRDTFPAIALAAAYLHDVKHLTRNDSLVICPVDPYVDNEFFLALHDMDELVKKGDANLILMGIQPTYPSEKYGYIIPKDNKLISNVKSFKEKPDIETAKGYIKKGALWNGGIFALKIGYLLDRSHELIDYIDYNDLYLKYNKLKKISFDYAVVEKEKNIQVLQYKGRWKDLGTWNTLTEEMNEDVIGNVICDKTCKNIHVINELNLPLLCMGGHDLIIAASPEGILVSDKEQSSYIKKHVDSIHQNIRYAEKSWGNYTVIDVGEESMTIHVKLHAGHRMNYHSHQHRTEVWTIIKGKGKTIIDGVRKDVCPGDVVSIKPSCKHTIIAKTELEVIEVQLGKDISVEDKKKYDQELFSE